MRTLDSEAGSDRVWGMKKVTYCPLVSGENGEKVSVETVVMVAQFLSLTLTVTWLKGKLCCFAAIEKNREGKSLDF